MGERQFSQTFLGAVLVTVVGGLLLWAILQGLQRDSTRTSDTSVARKETLEPGTQLPDRWQQEVRLEPGTSFTLRPRQLTRGSVRNFDWTNPVGGCIEIWSNGRRFAEDCGDRYISGPSGDFEAMIFRSRSHTPVTFTVTVTTVR